jgi:hypothetical protein
VRSSSPVCCGYLALGAYEALSRRSSVVTRGSRMGSVFAELSGTVQRCHVLGS